MENKNPNTEDDLFQNQTIDKMSISDALAVMIENQSEAIEAIRSNIHNIESIVLSIYEHITKSSDGRIVYAGAGTSARIGVQDGVELYPTFGWPRDRIAFLIAGGEKALLNSIEGSEDDTQTALMMTKKLLINKHDVVIGVAASGNTPFTEEILRESKKRNALTIAISNNAYGSILKFANHKLVLETGAEVISGSTRLKAGTAQKICLNTISNMLMIKLGNVINGKMINLVANNSKLKKRKSNILLSLNN